MSCFFVTCVYLRGNLQVRFPTQRKSLREFNLRPLVHSLQRRANARNVSFRISLRWPIPIINPVDKTKLLAVRFGLGFKFVKGVEGRRRFCRCSKSLIIDALSGLRVVYQCSALTYVVYQTLETVFDAPPYIYTTI